MRTRSFGWPAPAAVAAVVIGLVLLMLPDPALAQAGAALDGAAQALETMIAQASGRVRDWTRQLLIGLLVLDFVWRGGRWLLSGQSVSAFAESMLYTIGIVGLAWGFTTFGPAVVSFIAAEATNLAGGGQSGAGSLLTPSGIMAAGLGRTQQWIGQVGVTPTSWAFLVCAFISLVVLAASLAMVILVYAELYLVGLVGIATLGFAGLTQTRGIASRYVMSLVGKGFKLLTLLLVVDATHRLALLVVAGTMNAAPGTLCQPGAMQLCPWQPGATVSLEGALGAVLLQVIGGVLVILLPSAMERLVGGSSVGDVAGAGAKMVAGAAATGMTAAGGAALGAAGGAAAGGIAAGTPGGKAALKAATTGALKGGVNWGQIASQRGGITKELGARLSNRVNSIGSGKGSEGGGQ